jgi:DNA-binding transcriptional ArsR family regulator
MTESEQHAFKALADPTRRQILLHLSQGDKTIGELVDEFAMTRAAVKKHLDVLARGQMVSVHPRGRERINRLQPGGIQSVMNWLTYFDQFWDNKLNALQQVIAETPTAPATGTSTITTTNTTTNTSGTKPRRKKSSRKQKPEQ